MAYAFDKIMNQMDDKINIFGQQQQQGGAAGGDQPASSGESKTTTDGDVSAGGGPGSSNAGASAAPRVQGTQSSQLALAASQAQPQSSFKPFAEVGSRIAANNAAVQQEADDYVKAGKAAQTYKIEDSDVDKAIGGDAETGSKVGGRISQATINPVTKFTQKDLGSTGLEKLDNPLGMASYFRSQYGPSYTSGQSNFDLSTLQNNPKYWQELRALQGQQQDFNKRAAGFVDPEKGVEKEVSTYGASALEAEKKRLQDYLKAKQDSLEGTNAEELKVFADEVEKLKSDPLARAEKVKAGLSDPGIQTGLNQAIAANPELRKYLTPEAIAAFGLNPADFANVNAESLTSGNFYDADEAKRFNAINAMLGVGGPGKLAGTRPGAAATFDSEKYLKDILGRGTSANERANAGAQAGIKEIMENIAARRAQGIERGKGVNYEDIKNTLRNSMVGNKSRQGGNLDKLMGVDINKYFQGAPMEGLDDLDFLDADQASRLNSFYEELMDPRKVSAGRFAEGYNPNNYTMDTTGYENELNSMMPDYVAPPTPPPPPEPTVAGGHGGRAPMTDETGRILEEWEKALIRGGNMVGNAANTVFGRSGGGY